MFTDTMSLGVIITSEKNDAWNNFEICDYIPNVCTRQ